jgi:protein gp37
MAETTGIAWTRSTFNPWIGCTEVSPGCDACYARELDNRHRYGGATHWGAGVERYVTSLGAWLKPERWNAIALKEKASGKIEDRSDWHTPGFWPVFPSMCDPFDNEVADELRYTFWQLVLDNPALTWLLLTKRIGNAAKLLPDGWLANPPAHVWIGASVVNQEEADRDIPKLLATPAAKRFVSYEPALGPIDFTRISLGKSPMRVANSGDHDQQFRAVEFTVNALKGARSINWPGLDQIIVGGESNQGKHKARPFKIEWARSTLAQCRAAGVAFFMKQTGSDHALLYERVQKDRAGADPAEWPEDLRVQEFPV